MKNRKFVCLIISLMLLCLFVFTGCNKEYRVSFMVDGQDYFLLVVRNNVLPTPPDREPTKEPTQAEVYTFDKWVNAATGEEFDFSKSLDSDVVLNAVFTTSPRMYEINYEVDGVSYHTEEIAYGQTLTAPAAPTKASTSEQDYVFDGWYVGDDEWNFANDTVSNNVTLEARFTSSVRKYTVTYYNENSLHQTYTVVFGAIAPTPIAPQKASTVDKTFIFNKWVDGDGNEWNASTAISSDVELYAIYSEAVRKYLVSYKANGVTVKSEEVEYNATISDTYVVDGYEEDRYYYEFDKWTNEDGSDFDFTQPIVKDTVIVALFNRFDKVSVTFKNGDDEYEVQYLIPQTAATKPAIDPKNSNVLYRYEFLGWETEEGEAWDFASKVEDSIVLIAKYSEGIRKGSYDNSDPTFSFAMLSDIHLQVNDETSTQNFKRAVAQAKEISDIDAVVIAGDINDTIWWSKLRYEDFSASDVVASDNVVMQNNNTRIEEINHVKTVFEDTLDEETDLIYCLGNHDQASFTGRMGVKISYTQKYYEILSSSTTHDFFEHEDKTNYTSYRTFTHNDLLSNGLRYFRIGGAHFLIMDCKSFYGEVKYSAVQVNWLEEMLGYITKNYENEPVFLVTHLPIKGTIPASGSGSTEITEVLQKYPNTIALTGHVHESVFSEYGINQDLGFTAIELGSVKYSETKSYGAAPNSLKYGYVADLQASSQGLVIDVYEDSTIRIRRMNFSQNQSAGPDWIIDHIGASTRQTKYTTEYRKAQNTKPYFDTDTQISGEKVGNYLNVKFTHATDVEYKIIAYKAIASYADGSTKTSVISSDFYLKEGSVDYFTIAFDNADSIETVEVYPIDGMQLEGDSISIESADFITAPSMQPVVHTPTNAFGSIEVDGISFRATEQYRLTDSGVTTYSSMGANGNIYFDAYETDYEYSYDISKMRLSKASTTYGDANSNYSVGANLATFEYNGKIYSFNAYFYFGKYVDDKSDPEVTNRYRTNECKLSYYLWVSAPSNPLMCNNYSLTKWQPDCNVDLSAVTIGGEKVKDILKSDSGATLKVERKGDSFTISLDGQVLDTISLEGYYYDGNGSFVYFDDNTQSTFGISSYGAEAYFDNISYSLNG